MPGLLGIVASREGHDVRPTFGAVFGAMAQSGRLISETAVDHDNRWALGRVHLGVLQPAAQLDRDLEIHVMFHGDLENEAELAATLAADGDQVSAGATQIVRALYRRHGRRLGPFLKGAFCAAVLDSSTRQLLLISDRLGCYPVYWFLTPDRFVFASELRAALKAHPRPVINARAVADFLKFGFPMGKKTLAVGVDLLPQFSTLVYQLDTNNVSIEAYGSTAELFQPDAQDRAAYTESVQQAFDTAMAHTLRGSHRLALSLSGGLDTRVILSALDRMGQLGVHTFTLGGRGCADEVIAHQLARMARTSHRFIALDDHYLEDLLPTVGRMVTLTDGMYLSHGFTEMLALTGFESTEATLLIRGHCGELAKASTAWPFHTDARISGMRSVDEFIPYLLGRLTHVSRDDAARDVLSETLVETLDGAGAEASLRECLADATLSPSDLCSYVYLKEYHRRVTIPSLEIFRTALEIRMPFADVEFLRAVLHGPAGWRDGVQLHQALIAANATQYLRVRNPNTGAPAGAGPVTEIILDKVNTILRRLNVYGYRHYHSFDGWMRRTFLDLVDRVLLGPEVLASGIVRESAVRARVAEAHKGSTEHDDLLQALAIVGLWQKETGATV